MALEIKTIDTDVLVIGGGAAGLWAAIRARDFCPRVTLVDKARVARSGATTFTHCILAPVPEELLIPAMKEIVEPAAYINDQEMMVRMMREHRQRVEEMISWGVPFQLDKSGRLLLDKDRKQVVNNSIYVEGVAFLEKMKEHARMKGVNLIERVMAVELLTSDGEHPSDGRIAGVVGLETRTGRLITFRTGAVVVSAGATSGKLHLNYLDNITGDGQAMAFRAGAQLAGLEFATHPTFPIWERKFFSGHPAVFQIHGARLINRLGEEFIPGYYPGRSLQMCSPSEVGFAIAREAVDGRGPVYFDLTSWTEEHVALLRRILPSMMMNFDDVGIDVRARPMEAMPIVARWGGEGPGGIRIDSRCRSSIPGLFAAGASANIPIHSGGMTGVSQAGCYFTGHTAGENAAKFALEAGTPQTRASQLESLREEILSPLEKREGPSPADVYMTLNKVMVPVQFSFFKHEKRMKATLAEIKRVQREVVPRMWAADVHELIKANEARNYALLAEAVYRCALERQESRLSHYREDFPYRDDINWLKWVVLQRRQDGAIEVTFDPIPVETYPVRPARRTRIPSPLETSRAI
ncbi:MAG: FAD-dependent oxidoreductase [Dehalococcoidia bacterium]|nr:FAD-dependent oxidoreductase [Dehalococcoidia bacterium]